MTYLSLRPSQVVLDSENPRLPDGTSSDREAINRLLDDGAEALISLARDLARTGQTNPAELPIAVKVGSKYLILEGNRRFAALKLLKDPALADDEAHQKAFRRAAALGTPPTSVFTLVTSTSVS
jgi:ParB-like chromosome segregation protein Spo0J